MLELINTRRSVRQFNDDPVADQDIHDILEAAMNAPSTLNQQAWQFVVLTDRMLQDYHQFNPNAPKGAPVGILVCGDTKKQKAEGYYLHDCCAATQNILLAAHAKKLGAVWTAVLPERKAKIKAMLNLPDYVEPVAFVPIGKPAKALPDYASRFKPENVHRNQW